MARFSNETFELILQRMLDRLPSDIDKREGSVAYDMLAPAAAELAQSYIELQNVLDLGFVETSFGEYIDFRASEVGIQRKVGESATGTIEVRGLEGTVISVGTRFSTNETNPVYFITTEGTTIDSTGIAIIQAKAEEVGYRGNVGANKISIILSDLSSVITVNNTNAFSSGSDEETDEALMERYLERMKTPQTSGNINDYLKWAKEIEGIGDAKVFPIWSGPGTVKVVIVDSANKKPSTEKVGEVSDYIESVRPVGADVSVIGANEVPINIQAEIFLDESKTLEEANNELKAMVEYYLSEIAFEETKVRFNFISAILIQSPAILDYQNLTVNGSTANVLLGDEDIPSLGTITLTVVS